MSALPIPPLLNFPHGRPLMISEADLRPVDFVKKVGKGRTLSADLTAAEARIAFAQLLEGAFHPVQAGAFLQALRIKELTQDELNALADVFRSRLAALSRSPAPRLRRRRKDPGPEPGLRYPAQRRPGFAAGRAPSPPLRGGGRHRPQRSRPPEEPGLVRRHLGTGPTARSCRTPVPRGHRPAAPATGAPGPAALRPHRSWPIAAPWSRGWPPWTNSAPIWVSAPACTRRRSS